MNKVLKERSLLGLFIIITLTLLIFTEELNRKSFKDGASEIIFLVNSEVGNLRENPSTSSQILTKMKRLDKIRLLKREGEWFEGKHLRTLNVGWAHNSILGRYLQLNYYEDHILGESIFEID